MDGYVIPRMTLFDGLLTQTERWLLMAPEAWTDALVQEVWSVERDPDAAMVLFVVFECNGWHEFSGHGLCARDNLRKPVRKRRFK